MAKDSWYSKIQKMDMGLVADEMPPTRSEVLTLPSPSLNWALGGGLIFGKVATLVGPQQGGKSLVAQLAVAELHKMDPNAWAVWFDSEFSFDKEFAAKLGVDVKRLWLVQSNKPKDIFDQFVDKVWPMVQEGFPCRIMVIDSIKGIQGPKEADLESVENHVMGDLSQLLGKAFRKIVEPIRKHNILTLLIQQVNEEMDPAKQRVGIKWRIPSGMALKHFSDYIVLIEKVDAKATKIFDETHKGIQELPIQVGHTVRCKIEKNRTAAPYLVAEFRLKYGVGVVDTALEVATLAMNLGLVSRPTAVTYEFQGTKAQGFKNFVEKVEKTPELYRELLKAIQEFDVFSVKVDASSSMGGLREGPEDGQ